MYKVGLIGAGRISERHIEAMKTINQFKPVAISDINLKKAQQLGQKHGISAYESFKEMLIKEKLDVVVIALPHYLHMEVAIWSANNGCHILLEKPMAFNMEEAQKIKDAVTDNRVSLMVCYTQHYIPENIKAKQLIKEGKIGDLVLVNNKRYLNYFAGNRPEWFFYKEKAGGGIVMNLGSHSVDQIQWITNSSMTNVKASLSYNYEKGDVESSGLIYLETNKGFPVTISLSGLTNIPINETEFIGTKGSIIVSVNKGLFISNNDVYEKIDNINKTKPFILQYFDFLDLLEEKKSTLKHIDYSETVVKTIDAIYKSDTEEKEIQIYK